MSKRKDRERAASGNIFRDGKLQPADPYNEKAANAKLLMNFFKKRRLPCKEYPVINCPVCKTSKPAMAMRINKVIECLCRKCFFNWEMPQ